MWKVIECVGGDAPTNGGENVLDAGRPYVARIKIQGVANLLFHRWNVESVAAKASAAKGSKAKKEDDIESYVYRMRDGDPTAELGLPGEYLRGAIIGAAKFRQDPRSPRKSAVDLYKAGIVSLTPLAGLGVSAWDYLDKRRVQVQRAGITRVRPALLTGWMAEFDVLVNLPQYIPVADLQQVLVNAGSLIGVGDFRPTYGRFTVVGFSLL